MGFLSSKTESTDFADNADLKFFAPEVRHVYGAVQQKNSQAPLGAACKLMANTINVAVLMELHSPRI